MNAHGVMSATLFHSPSQNPYVLCTTAPSSERSQHGGEWTYISAVGDGPATVPECLEDNLEALARHDAILVGAVSEDGNLISVLEKSGRLTLVPLKVSNDRLGGIATIKVLKNKLCQQSPLRGVDQTCLRFHDVDGMLYLMAVDVEGYLITQRLDPRFSQPFSPQETSGYRYSKLSSPSTPASSRTGSEVRSGDSAQPTSPSLQLNPRYDIDYRNDAMSQVPSRHPHPDVPREYLAAQWRG